MKGNQEGRCFSLSRQTSHSQPRFEMDVAEEAEDECGHSHTGHLTSPLTRFSSTRRGRANHGQWPRRSVCTSSFSSHKAQWRPHSICIGTFTYSETPSETQRSRNSLCAGAFNSSEAQGVSNSGICQPRSIPQKKERGGKLA
jgi:hypothetical protein